MSSEKLRASHILIKHQGSRRKSSWKDPDGKIISATTRADAVSQLRTLREDLLSGRASFSDLAAHYSHCSSAKRGGDLGSFGRGQMGKPFDEATLALKIGEISDIVDTDRGVHIIKRTGHEKLEATQSAKIESNGKRKIPPISSVDIAVGDSRHHHHKKHTGSSSSKKTEISSEKVRASHILIKHQGSRRKSSWKDPEGSVITATTRDDAVSQLQALHKEILSGASSFSDLASRHSHCSSAKRGGDLGSFGRGQMQRPFEEATYALNIGEISEIIDTDSGVHIIKRTG